MKKHLASQNPQLLIHKNQVLIMHFNKVTQLANLLHLMSTRGNENTVKKILKTRIKSSKTKQHFNAIK